MGMGNPERSLAQAVEQALALAQAVRLEPSLALVGPPLVAALVVAAPA
jgi:hypothetical protein